MISQLISSFKQHADRDVLIWQGRPHNYNWLLDRVISWRETIKSRVIPRGSVVALESDFSPNALALFLALADHRCIILPLAAGSQQQKQQAMEISRAEFVFQINEKDMVKISTLDAEAREDVYWLVWQAQRPGLVLMTPGQDELPIAVVHDLTTFCHPESCDEQRRRIVTLPSLEEITGIHILFDVLRTGGCLVAIQDRNRDSVLEAVQRFRVDYLPASVAAAEHLLAGDSQSTADLSSLKTVLVAGIGTAGVLDRLSAQFPAAGIEQKFCSAELGLTPFKLLDTGDAKIKCLDESMETRVVDGTVQLKTSSMMLGYLNVPSPFTEDGWLNVEQVANPGLAGFAQATVGEAESFLKINVVEETSGEELTMDQEREPLT